MEFTARRAPKWSKSIHIFRNQDQNVKIFLKAANIFKNRLILVKFALKMQNYGSKLQKLAV